MRRLTPGDITRKLAQIEQSGRSRRWKRKAKAKLLDDVGARKVPGTANMDTPTGRLCVKRRYPTFTTAYQALIDTWKSPNKGRRKEKRVHPCPHCRGWHLTSQDQEERPNGDTEKAHRRDPRLSEAREDQGDGERHP